jgi:hypothetical protein
LSERDLLRPAFARRSIKWNGNRQPQLRAGGKPVSGSCFRAIEKAGFSGDKTA